MGAEPGPEVVGYKDSHESENVEPQGEEEIVVDAHLQADIEIRTMKKRRTIYIYS